MPPQSSVVRGTDGRTDRSTIFSLGFGVKRREPRGRKAAIGGCNRRLARGTNILERSCVPPAGL